MPTPAPERKFRDLVGLVVKFSQGEPASDLALLEALRVHWVRDFMHWSEIERTAGHFEDFSPEFRARLEFYRAHDIGVVYVLGYANSVAYPAIPGGPFRPVEPQAFGRYAREVARMLEAAHVRFVLEIWNEPHNFGLRSLLGGSWNGRPPSPWVDHYVRMVREAVAQVKTFDPSVKLLTNDDMWVLHYWFLEQGLPRKLDGFAFHPYTHDEAIGPEMTSIGPRTNWVEPFTAVDADRSFRSAVRRLRDRGRAKLGKTPEMWVTEWGWKIGEKIPEGTVTEDTLAGFLPRAYIVAAAAGVQVVCWFSSRDSVDGAMGLTTNDGRKRKSYFAFETLTRELGDYGYARQVAGSAHPTSGVQAFLFSGQEGPKLAIWNIDSATGRVRIAAALGGVRAVDALGREVPLAESAGGDRSAPIGPSPIYLAFTHDVPIHFDPANTALY